jgi:parallel beta-helix repeat protein
LTAATYKTAYLLQCNGINIQGGTFLPDALPTANSVAFRLVQSSNIVLDGVTIKGKPATNGVPFDAIKPDKTGNVIGTPSGKALDLGTSSGVVVQRCDISGTHKGIILGGGADVTIVGNVIHSLRTSQITGVAGDNTTISRNRFYGSKPWRFGANNAPPPVGDGGSDGDHMDAIHVFTRRGGVQVRGLVITDNLCETGGGLGIALDDGSFRLGFVNATITGNTIIGSHPLGIVLENVSRSTISNNSAFWTGQGTMRNQAPRIHVADGSNNLTLAGNRALNFNTALISFRGISDAQRATIVIMP